MTGGGTRRKQAGSGGAEAIYQEIYQAILDHRLRPGTKLPEDGLGDVFGVSRTVIREVLGRLAHKNIIEVRPHRTALVASPSAKEAQDIFRARCVLEQEAVRQAALTAKREGLEALRRLCREESEAQAREDQQARIRLASRFHLKLAELAGNAVIVNFLGELVSRTALVMAAQQAPHDTACAQAEHGPLVEAVAARDAEGAAALMAAHLQAVEDRLSPGAARAVDLAAVFGRAGRRAAG